MAVAAVLLTIAAASPTPGPSVPVIVATKSVPAGQRLSAADLRVAHYPPELVPGGHASNPDQFLERVLAVGADAGQPLSEHHLVSARAVGPEPGRVIAPVRVADGDIAGLVRVGDRVDVLASNSEGSKATTLARSARVAALPTRTEGGPMSASSSSGPLILIEVDANTAATLAGSAGSRLTLLLR